MLNLKRNGWYVVQPTNATFDAVEFTESRKAPTLETLQQAVGGYIEHVALRGCDAFVNEEGKLDGLPFNRLGSQLYGNPYDGIVGPMVVVCGQARRGL